MRQKFRAIQRRIIQISERPMWSRISFLYLCFLLLVVWSIFATTRIEYSSFIAIDGDFQNYNGYRRLLDGQIPFKDFVFYLGLGPLYLHSIVLLIIGNTFTHSLFATYFLSAAAFSFCIYVVARLNLLSPIRTVGLTILIAIVAAGHDAAVLGYDVPTPYYRPTVSGYGEYLPTLQSLSSISFLRYFFPGTSDRIIRSLVPFLCVAAVALFILLAKRSKRVQQVQDYIMENQWRLFFTIGCLFGIILPWSNDYGISAALAGAIILGIRYFKFTLTFFLQYTTFFIALVIGTVSSVTLLTFGHLVEWFDYNFIGVGSYQFWYYGIFPKLKVFQVTDIPFNNWSVLLTIGLIFWFLYRERMRQNTLAQTGLLFLLLSCLIAFYTYAIFSENSGLVQPLKLICSVSIISQLLSFFHVSQKSVRRAILFCFLASISWLLYQKATDVQKLFSAPRSGYHESLGGFVPGFHEDLLLLDEVIPDGEKVFSTYASALEVELGQFQPSGYDYTIHVLGDRQRAQYLQSFFDTDPQFVTTMRQSYAHWELWNVRANWFFYREMLKTHEPIFASHYNVLWKKREAPFNSSVTATCQVDKKNHQLKIQADTTDSELYADVKLSYTTSWKHRLKSLGIQKIVHVEDFRMGYFLPDNATAVHIPIELVEGNGAVTIQSYPLKHTKLDITDCEVSQILPVLTKERVESDYAYKVDSLAVSTIQAADFTDSNWTGGIKNDGKTILVPYTLVRRVSLQRAKTLTAPNGAVAQVSNVDVAPDWIAIQLKEPIGDGFGFPLELKIGQ